MGVEQAIVPHLKEGYLGYLLIGKFYFFFKQIEIFRAYF